MDRTSESSPGPHAPNLPPSVLDNDGARSRGFVLTADGQGMAHCYVGGRFPASAPAGGLARELTYFATVPSPQPKREAVYSLFLAPVEELSSLTGRWNPLGGVQVVEHSPSPRIGQWVERCSRASEHGIRLLEQDQSDQESRGDGSIVGVQGQKFGGTPAFLSYNSAEREWPSLTKAGFRQLVQFDWPTSEPDVQLEGDWPFGDGVFSLLFRAGQTLEWRWCWQLG